MKTVVTANGVSRVALTQDELSKRQEEEQAFSSSRVLARKDKVKEIANKLITDRFPMWRQSNMHGRSNELQLKMINGETLTTEEQAEKNKLLADWAWVKSVRAHSDSLEAGLDNDIDTDIHSGWPVYE